MLKVLEECFLKHAPKVFEQKSQPIVKLAVFGFSRLKELDMHLEEDILITYMRCRMYLRIKSLNQQAIVQKVLNRRANKLARITGDKFFKKKYLYEIIRKLKKLIFIKFLFQTISSEEI